MPTMQNRTRNAVAVTCSDSRLISAEGFSPAGSELAEFPELFISRVRICPVPLIPIYVSSAESEDMPLDKRWHAKDSVSRSGGTSQVNLFELPKRRFESSQRRKPCRCRDENCAPCFPR